MSGSSTPLVLVSNPGPVTFEEGGEVRRGTGGLVTALTGLASHREVTWTASAMTEEDVAVAERHHGRPFPVHAPDGSIQATVAIRSPAAIFGSNACCWASLPAPLSASPS